MRTPKSPVPGISKLSELTIDQTGRLIPAIPLTIDTGVTRIIPSGSHTELFTAHDTSLTVNGTLQVDGSFVLIDLGN